MWFSYLTRSDPARCRRQNWGCDAQMLLPGKASLAHLATEHHAVDCLKVCRLVVTIS